MSRDQSIKNDLYSDPPLPVWIDTRVMFTIFLLNRYSILRAQIKMREDNLEKLKAKFGNLHLRIKSLSLYRGHCIAYSNF